MRGPAKRRPFPLHCGHHHFTVSRQLLCHALEGISALPHRCQCHLTIGPKCLGSPHNGSPLLPYRCEHDAAIRLELRRNKLQCITVLNYGCMSDLWVCLKVRSKPECQAVFRDLRKPLCSALVAAGHCDVGTADTGEAPRGICIGQLPGAQPQLLLSTGYAQGTLDHPLDLRQGPGALRRDSAGAPACVAHSELHDARLFRASAHGWAHPDGIHAHPMHRAEVVPP
mmetsp:Transcript_37662/g.119737  ORF Transcript_37662/g.119737 Transcript_37662/m.119737 type:complete len:226 (-) Transcript_37662:580-1257(-)